MRHTDALLDPTTFTSSLKTSLSITGRARNHHDQFSKPAWQRDNDQPRRGKPTNGAIQGYHALGRTVRCVVVALDVAVRSIGLGVEAR